MPSFDDRLTRELVRVARPASAAGAFERVDGRRARRARQRRLQTGLLAVVVLVGTAGGFVTLSRAFQDDGSQAAEPAGVRNGAIVLSRVTAGEGTSLWVVSPDGERRLTDEPAVSDLDAAVSPDGRTVAFVRIDTADRSTIWLVGIDGGEPRRLTDPRWSATGPAWSPDGLQLVFSGDAGDGYGLYVIADLEGAAPHRITGRDLGRPSDPTWSPDGSTIVFAVWSTDPGVGEPINYDLFAASADGSGEATRLTDTPDVAETEPAFSPDGRRIAFVRVPHTSGEAPSGGIAVMAADGSDVQELLGGASEHSPTWAPDGSAIAFARPYPSGLSVFTIRLDGSELTRVSAGAEPAWQPLIGEASPSPTSSSSTLPSPSPTAIVVDVTGFAFPVCNARGIGGDFDGNGTDDVAYVVTKMSDVGGCPQADQATNLLAVDLDGDAKVDAEGGPIGCEIDCRPFMAIDLEGDGQDELLVQELGGAILGIVPYELSTAGRGSALVAIPVGGAGDRPNGFPTGEPAMLYLGGDEGFAARLTCRAGDAGLDLTAITGQLDSIEQPTTWKIRRTVLRLKHPYLTIVDSSTSLEPIGGQGPFGSEVGSGLCGHPFPENGAFPT